VKKIAGYISPELKLFILDFCEYCPGWSTFGKVITKIKGQAILFNGPQPMRAGSVSRR